MIKRFNEFLKENNRFQEEPIEYSDQEYQMYLKKMEEEEQEFLRKLEEDERQDELQDGDNEE